MRDKTLILTGFTDNLRSENETDNKMEEVFELTLPSKKRYALKHGYDLLALNSFGKVDNLFDEINIGFLRAFRAFELLSQYDVVMWIDADALITNDTYTIDDFIFSNESCFYASWDWDGKTSMSTGNFILHKNKNIENFFNTFIDVAKHVMLNNLWGEEQTTFNLMYKHKIVPTAWYTILEHKYLNSVLSKPLMKQSWETRAEIPFPWDRNSFLVHLTGISNRARINLINEHFKEFI